MSWEVRSKFIHLGFIVALGLLIAIAIVSQRNSSRLIDDARQLEFSQKVLYNLSNILQTVVDAESNSRSYAIFGRESSLAPYEQASRSTNREVQRLRQLTLDNANYQKGLESLDGTITEKLSLMQRAIEERKIDRFDSAMRTMMTNEGDRLMSEIRTTVGGMEQEANRILVQRTRQSRASAQRTTLTLWTGIALSFILLFCVFILLNRGLAQRRRSEEQLRQYAFYDPLTGLPNRALFMDRLGRSMEHASRRPGYVFAVLFLDLDRFKNINDSLGHMIGDLLLTSIAQRLRICIRSADTVARLGGDEFAILLDDIVSVDDAVLAAERILAELVAPFMLEGEEVFTSTSIGIALNSTGYDRAEDLLRDADTAMYRAKALGKTRYEVFDVDMHAHAVALLQMEADLRRAIERHEFILHYQPIVALRDRRIVGFEALVRWPHPSRGLISPAEFIPVAEETGLIVPLGQWVMQEGCRWVKECQDRFPGEHPISVSINVSAKQFSQPDLIPSIQQTLETTGLSPKSLRVEITESVIMDNFQTATTLLSKLQEMGVEIYMDDFGTGYSSLSYLHRFPVDTLKVDRSFISDMCEESENARIVRTIVDLAHDLGMSVVAEGVERIEQEALLLGINCDFAQGYFYSKPVAPDAAEALLTRQFAATEAV